MAQTQPEKAGESVLRREPAEDVPGGPARPSPGVVPLPKRQEQVAEPATSGGGPPLPWWPRSRRALLFALLPIALIAGGYVYVTGGQVMSTDDAYVEADKVGVSTDVSGTVQQVDATENQHVKAGQVLYRLDPRQFQIALDNVNTLLAVSLIWLSATGVASWWIRRPKGQFGIPPARDVRWSNGMVIPLCVMSLLLPIFGLSVIAIAAIGWVLKWPLRWRPA